MLYRSPRFVAWRLERGAGVALKMPAEPGEKICLSFEAMSANARVLQGRRRRPSRHCRVRAGGRLDQPQRGQEGEWVLRQCYRYVRGLKAETSDAPNRLSAR